MRNKKLDPIESTSEALDNEDINANKPKAKKADKPSKDKSKKASNSNAKEKITNLLTNGDSELSELYSLLEPEDYEISISDKRIKRARLVCQSIDRYSEQEKSYLIYPTLYQLHLYGYQLVEISAILGLAPSTIHSYLKNIRKAFKHQYLDDKTSEEIIGESIAHFDFISKEALKQASMASENNKAGFMRLSAQAESEKNKILDNTGYFDMIRRRNELQALDSSNTSEASEKNELMNDIKEIVAEYKILKSD
jgi:hypothetical protein